MMTPSRPKASPRVSRGTVAVFSVDIAAVYGSRQHRTSTLRPYIPASVSAVSPAHEEPLTGPHPRRRRHAHRPADGALLGAHPPAAAGAGQPAAVGARMRPPPWRQRLHGGGGLRPAPGARSRRCAPPARL